MLSSLPLLWPTGGNSASDYVGHTPANSVDINQDFGEGKDDGGAMVVASHNGYLNRVGFDAGGYGNWIEVTENADGTGYRTRYGHLSAFGPGITAGITGDAVFQGQIIGYVGTTGASTGNHLHYEVRDASGTVIDITDPDAALAPEFYKGILMSSDLQSAVRAPGELLSYDLFGFDWNEGIEISIVDQSNQVMNGASFLTNPESDRSTTITINAPMVPGTYEVRVRELNASPGTPAESFSIDPRWKGTSVALTLCVASQSGVTIITHGWQGFSGESAQLPEWVASMATGIAGRQPGGSIYFHDRTFANGESWSDTPRGIDNWTWINSNDPNEEIVLVYDWVWESDDFEGGQWLEAAADNLFAGFLNPPPGLASVNILSKPIHFIGHSRGAVLNSEVVRRIGYYFDVNIDQVTSLDPHPLAGLDTLLYTPDPAMRTFSNVTWADNYWRQNSDGDTLDFAGNLVAGAWNVELDESVLTAQNDDYDPGYGYEHSDVHLWYAATVRPEKNQDVEAGYSIDSYMSEHWWTRGIAFSSTAESNSGRAKVGFARSRIGGQSQPELDKSAWENPKAQRLASILNGDFEYGDTSENEVPGWERHGGDGGGTLMATGQGEAKNQFLALNSNGSDRTHNPLYVPADAEFIAFYMQRIDASDNDSLKVYLGGQELKTFSLAGTDSKFTPQWVPIPSDRALRGTAQTLEFRIVAPGVFNVIDSEVLIDNVAFSTDANWMPPPGTSPPSSQIYWGNQGTPTDTFTPEERAAVNRAIGQWDSLISSLEHDTGTLLVTITKEDLAARFANVAGSASWTGYTYTDTDHATVSARGIPQTGVIVIDDNGGGLGWLSPETPDSAFPDVVTAFVSSGGPPGIDMYSAVLQELTHALGFSTLFAQFAGHVDASRVYHGATSCGDFSAQFIADKTHLDAFAHPNDLMNEVLRSGTRMIPTDLDARILVDAFGYDLVLPSEAAGLTAFDAASGTLRLIAQNRRLSDEIVVRLDRATSSCLVAEVNGVLTYREPSTAPIQRIEVLGADGRNDTLVVDFLNGNPIPAGGLYFDGRGQQSNNPGDQIVVRNDLDMQSSEHVIQTNISSGSHKGIYRGDGYAINYTDIEPVTDLNIVAHREWTSEAAGAQQIRLADDPDGSAGMSIIDSNGTNAFEKLLFTNPTVSQTINAGDGDDVILIQPLDAGFSAPITANGDEGNDTFTVTPSPTAPIHVDGGTPLGTAPWNKLNLLCDATTVKFEPGASGDEGTYYVGANQPVTFDNTSDVLASSSGDVTVMGTNGDDHITIRGLGADSLVATVNDGPEMRFDGVTSLVVDALHGDDDIDVELNGLKLTGFTVQGGLPTAGSDSLVISGAGAAAGVSWTPDGIESGSFITPLQTIAVSGIEELIYDGEGDGDTLTVNGTSGGDTILHTPGAAVDSGLVRVNSLLAVGYVSLGSAGGVTIDGQGSSDTLAVEGTQLDDSVTVAADGSLALTNASGARTKLTVASLEALKVSGLAGADSFLVNGPQTAYATIDLYAGDNASFDQGKIVGDGAAGVVATLNADGTAMATGGGLNTVSFHGIDMLAIDAKSRAVSLVTTSNDEVLRVTPMNVGGGTVEANGMGPVVNYSNATSMAVDLGDGKDALVLLGAAGADTMTLTETMFTIAGRLPVTYDAANVEALLIESGLGDDGLTVEDVRAIGVPVTFDGGANSDTLTVKGTANVVYMPGPDVLEGRLDYGTTTIDFLNLEPVVDVVTGTLTVVGTDGPDSIDYRVGSAATWGLVSVDGFEWIEFENKTTLTVNALAGDDVVNLNNPTTPTGLTSIVVNGNDGDDRVTTRSGTPVNVTMNGDAGFDFLDASGLTGTAVATIEGGDGDDVLVGSSQIDSLRGGSGEDTIISGDGADFVDGGADFDVLVVSGTPGNNRILVFQTAPSSVIDAGYQLQVALDGNDLGNDVIAQTVAGVAPNAPGSAPTVEEVRIEAGRGNDLIQVGHADAYTDGIAGNGLPSQMVRFYVLGDAPNASDRLVVTDDGPGDLVLVRQALDERSGRVTVAPDGNNGPGEVVYEGIERLDVTPHNPVTGGTGTDGLGRIVVFQPDPFELNDDRLNPTDIQDVLSQHRDPTIDPGGVSDPFGWGDILGDEDWYEFRSTKIGTFRFDVLFTEIAQLSNGREGLPGDGALDTAVYDAAGNLIVLGTPTAGGEQATFSAAAGKNYYLRVHGATAPAINTYDVRLIEVDLVGPQLFDPDGMGPLSPVHITENTATAWAESAYDLFDPKPSAGPTPRVDSLTLHFRDLVSLDQLGRAPGDLYPALDALIAARDGRYAVVGDHSGRIAIASIAVTNDPLLSAPGAVQAGATATLFAGDAGLSPVDDFYTGQILLFAPADGGPLAGQARLVSDYVGATRTFTLASGFSAAPAAGATFQVLPMATASVELRFAAPLPDDRYTLTVGDTLLDPAGNLSDGENNAAEPQDHPQYPTGDGVAGGNFVARFTVDSRPEFGTVCCGGVYVDINGDFVFDPEGRLQDAVNRDLVFRFGETTDGLFAGNFAAAGAASASGFDKLGAYGYVAGKYRFLLDLDHDGVADFSSISGVQVNAIPVAGDFAAGHPGDEIGIFDGTRWHLDSDGDNVLEATDTTIDSQLRGLPVVGNFGGSSADDLATLDVNTNTVSFDLNRDGVVDDTLIFPLPGWVERILAGDVNLDGIDDLVFWVPGRDGQPADEAAEWYVLVSDRPGTGLPSFVFEAFSPAPLGNDLFALFGDQSALPIFGNFDPPVSGAGLPYIPHTNPVAAWDVNNDGMVTPVDALLLINQLNTSGAHPLVGSAMIVGPFYDPSGDGTLSPVDVLAVINWLNAQTGAGAEGESEVTANMLGEDDIAWYPGAGSGVTVDAVRTGSASQAKLPAAAPADAGRVSGLDSAVWAVLRSEDTAAARRDRIRAAVLADVQGVELEQDWDSLLTMLADDFVR